jgi:hypothetical protein
MIDPELGTFAPRTEMARKGQPLGVLGAPLPKI